MKTIKISLIILIFSIFILSIPPVRAPCCAEGCYPDAKCCATTGTYKGIGVIGCPAKIGTKIQYLCPGDILPSCGTCFCETRQNCFWVGDNSLCEPDKFCSITYEGSSAVSSLCISRCQEGTKLCGDNTCKALCDTSPSCDSDCNNGKADSCSCSECFNKQASCGSALVCDKFTKSCIGTAPCPEGTTICKDGFCRANCFLNGAPGPTPDNGDNICNGANAPMEGCTVLACISETSPCDPGLYCKDGLCKKIPTDCPICKDCDKGFGDTCSLAECHDCDLSKCYYYESFLLGSECADCPGQCSDYNKDADACNAKIKGCEKNCYYIGEKCESCTPVKKCQDYNNKDTCIANPCKIAPLCTWKSNICIPTTQADPDDTIEACESIDATQIQGICDSSGEQNCWDESAIDKTSNVKCCGDDKALDTWHNTDGSGCIEGVYYKKRDDNINLCGIECADKSLNCWSSLVSVDYEDTKLTRCCELSEQWAYSTNNRLQNLLVKESCTKTEWYKITRPDTVTYYEVYR